MSEDAAALADDYRKRALATADVDHQALLLFIAEGFG